MSRAITVGNGNLLVGIDSRGQVRDFYFPYAGHSNHVSGASGSYVHRIGIWIDGTLRWLSHDSWEVTTTPDQDSILDVITARNNELGISLNITSIVHNERDLFLRKILVTSERNETRTVKIFFGQEFRISESRRGDTAFYDPRVGSVIHYKGHEAFLVHALCNDKSFERYSIGLFGIEGKEGTYTDAEDGELSMNPIEHGSVDSVIGITHAIDGGASVPVYYWITAGRTIAEAQSLHHTVLSETPERLMVSARNYWHAWTHKESKDFSSVEPALKFLYYRALLVIRMHADNRGGIIASSDSDVLNQGRDTYSYVWPRDAAISAHALDRAGYFDTAKSFYAFIAKLLEGDGYLMHKYRVDGVLGSSWHPWVRDGMYELPIQEDETALPVYMLLKHYEQVKDLEFIESLYDPFIEPASDFMCSYIDRETGLPASSYDLWEEKFGSSTYSASVIYGALNSAAQISTLLGKRSNAEKYRTAAEKIKHAILTYLYDVEQKCFIKLVRQDNGKIVRDTTIDISSLHGIINFGVLDVQDIRVANSLNVIEEKLKVPTSYGGFMRYEGDNYYRTSLEAPPNAWCITTLWIAQYYIKAARSRKDLEKPYGILLWVRDRASQSGILPEQINPHTGEHLSTSPLVWSHAEFVITLDRYMQRHKELS
ncbi:MAG: glycoside hydrolase family 15 protein [Candidatus Pacebacteria bacterium]|nr:glycoside hydrolase family 15 protein [Candidatus Paceibacterota bacterium]MCF7857195.1 glycoside hydrolase family 15 protein [Candidatus Paceibacterota bacterium]